MPRTSLLKNLTTPAALTVITSIGEAALAAWALRRKPRTSAAVARRALFSEGLMQGSVLAAAASTRSALTGEVLVAPIDAYRGPVGDVPLLIGQGWETAPTVTTVNDKLIMVAGPDYEKLSRAEQEAQYRRALHEYFPASTTLALVGGAALSRGVLHRALIGTRASVSKKRSTTLAFALMGAEAAIYAAARQITAQRRVARVARER